MMADNVKILVDASTGSIIEVPMTEEEIATKQAMLDDLEAKRIEAELAAQAREEARTSAVAKLAALGLTEEEIAAIIG